MKREVALLVFFLSILLLSLAAKPAFALSKDPYNVEVECIDDTCVSGSSAKWYLTINNIGRTNIEYVGFELVDSVTGAVFADYQVDFNPLSSDRGDTIIVYAKSEKTITLTGKVPEANIGTMLFFYPCFTTTFETEYVRFNEGKYETRHCESINFSIEVLECVQDIDCEFGMNCNDNSCEEFFCDDCQYQLSHSCEDYECCSSSDCSPDEVCLDHICSRLNCSATQGFFNHTCYDIVCAKNEYISSHSCVSVNCSYDQFIYNGTCVGLECKGSEYAEEHECKSLDCRYDEYAFNHTCVSLNCRDDEAVLDHECMPLDCGFFGKPKNHTCEKDSDAISTLTIELFVVLIIIFLLIIDLIRVDRMLTGKKVDSYGLKS